MEASQISASPVEVEITEDPSVDASTAPALPPNDHQAVSYLEYVKYVAENSPILSKEFRDCQGSDKLDVIILDIKEDGTLLEPKIFGKSKSISRYIRLMQLEGQHPSWPTVLSGSKRFDLARFLEEPKPPSVAARLILAEDLSQPMIEALGLALELDPSFFSEHLVGAKHELNDFSANYPDPSSDTMNEDEVHREFTKREFYSMKPKNHFCWSWKRRTWAVSQVSLDPAELKGLRPGSTAEGVIHKASRRQAIRDTIREAQQKETLKKAISNSDTNLYRTYEHHIFEAHRSVSENTIIHGIGIAEERISFLVKRDNTGTGWTGIFLFDPIRSFAKKENFVHEVLYEYDSLRIQPTPSLSQFKEFRRARREKDLTYTDPSTRNKFATHIISMYTTEDSSDAGGGPACTYSMDLGDSSSFLHPIFHLVLHGWQSVLQKAGQLLDEVDASMWKNNTRQGELVAMFGKLRKALFEDGERIREVIDEKALGEMKTEYEIILKRIENLKERTEKTSNALMSSIAILEGKKAISQAASITRLTELAFLFIPLTFSTSLFSMGIKGWSQNLKFPMWILVATVLVLETYIVRFIARCVRSQFVRARQLREVPGLEDSPSDDGVPTKFFLRWYLRSYSPNVVLAVLSATVYLLDLCMSLSDPDRPTNLASKVCFSVMVFFSANLFLICPPISPWLFNKDWWVWKGWKCWKRFFSPDKNILVETRSGPQQV